MGLVDENSIFPTPEAAALAAWAHCPEAEAKVVSVTYKGSDDAVVLIDTVPSHPETNHCERRGHGWVLLAAHN